jgi:hypothetical protein
MMLYDAAAKHLRSEALRSLRIDDRAGSAAPKGTKPYM